MAIPALDRLCDELDRTAVISDSFKQTISAWAHKAVEESYHLRREEHKKELEAMQATIDRLREELRQVRPPVGATHRVKWIVGDRWFWVKDIDFDHGTFRNGFAADTWPCDEPHRDTWGRGLFNAEEAKTLVAL